MKENNIKPKLNNTLQFLPTFPSHKTKLISYSFLINFFKLNKGMAFSPCLILFLSRHNVWMEACKEYLIQNRAFFSMFLAVISLTMSSHWTVQSVLGVNFWHLRSDSLLTLEGSKTFSKSRQNKVKSLLTDGFFILQLNYVP